MMPGMGAFLFRPMALAVAFAMIAALFLALSFVPALCSLWLRPHPQPVVHHGKDYEHRSAHELDPPRSIFGRVFARWEALINLCIGRYVGLLNIVMRRRFLAVASALVLLAAVLAALGPRLRREFFPEVDAGAFEMYVRAKTGTRIEATEKRVAAVEKAVRDQIGGDLELIVSELG